MLRSQSGCCSIVRRRPRTAALIKRALKPGGDLFLANGNLRSVPTAEQGWVNDGVDIKAMVDAAFEPVREGRFVREKTTDIIAEGTFWTAYKRPAA